LLTAQGGQNHGWPNKNQNQRQKEQQRQQNKNITHVVSPDYHIVVVAVAKSKEPQAHKKAPARAGAW
jgi:hypothetical protein